MRYSNGFPKENKTFTFHVNTTTSFSDWRRVIGSYSIPRKSLYYGQAWLRSWSRYIVFTFMFGKSCGDNESIRYTVVSIGLWTSNMLWFSVHGFWFYSMFGGSFIKIENRWLRTVPRMSVTFSSIKFFFGKISTRISKKSNLAICILNFARFCQILPSRLLLAFSTPAPMLIQHSLAHDFLNSLAQKLR